VGVSPVPAVVSTASQTIRVIGAAGTTVRLLRIEAALDVENVPGGGFDLQPFEANLASAAQEYSDSIPGSGILEIGVMLSSTPIAELPNATPGFNYFMAVTDNGAGTGATSNKIVLRYVP